MSNLLGGYRFVHFFLILVQKLRKFLTSAIISREVLRPTMNLESKFKKIEIQNGGSNMVDPLFS